MASVFPEIRAAKRRTISESSEVSLILLPISIQKTTRRSSLAILEARSSNIELRVVDRVADHEYFSFSFRDQRSELL